MWMSRLGWVVAAVIGLPVTAVGALAIPPSGIASTVIVAALVGNLARIPACGQDENAGSSTGRGVLAGATTAGGVLFVAGLVALLGAGAAVVLAVLGAATSLLYWHWRSLTGSASRQDIATPPDIAEQSAIAAATTPGQDSIRQMSTQELCLAWRKSFSQLQHAPVGPAREHIVNMRSSYLDEIERRDPDGFARWLHTGARAGSDPSRYVADDC